MQCIVKGGLQARTVFTPPELPEGFPFLASLNCGSRRKVFRQEMDASEFKRRYIVHPLTRLMRWRRDVRRSCQQCLSHVDEVARPRFPRLEAPSQLRTLYFELVYADADGRNLQRFRKRRLRVFHDFDGWLLAR